MRRNNMKPIDEPLIIAQSKILSERPATIGINLLQGNGSFVITDSSEGVLKFMKEAGYDIKYDIKNDVYIAIKSELKEN